MQLRHIIAMVAVADSGSLRAAAKRLGVSQPALTKAIREIETLMGCRFCRRRSKAPSPPMLAGFSWFARGPSSKRCSVPRKK